MPFSMFSRHKHFRQSFAQHLKIIINRLSVNKYAVVIQNSFGSKHSRREDICVRFPFIFFFFCFCLLTNSPIWWILFLVVRHILCGDSVEFAGRRLMDGDGVMLTIGKKRNDSEQQSWDDFSLEICNKIMGHPNAKVWMTRTSLCNSSHYT